MRPRVSWMNHTDDRILELLDETGLVLSPKVLAHNLEYDRSWVSRRLSGLKDANLVEQQGRGLYSITSLGKQYLNGEVGAEQLED